MRFSSAHFVRSKIWRKQDSLVLLLLLLHFTDFFSAGESKIHCSDILHGDEKTLEESLNSDKRAQFQKIPAEIGTSGKDGPAKELRRSKSVDHPYMGAPWEEETAVNSDCTIRSRLIFLISEILLSPKNQVSVRETNHEINQFNTEKNYIFSFSQSCTHRSDPPYGKFSTKKKNSLRTH